MNYDVIVIGAGSMGMSAGYHLSKSGKKTLLLDAGNPPHNKGSHHGETRMTRYAYAEGPEYIPFILRAKELWSEVEQAVGKELFMETGVLSMGEESSDFIQGTMHSAKQYQLPLDTMTAGDIRYRWPEIHIPDHYVGLLEPTSGVLRSEAIIQAYKQLAESHGAHFRVNSRVKDISLRNDRVIVKTEYETFEAESIVVSTGAWSKELLSMMELDLPLTPLRKTFAWFEADEEIYGRGNFPGFAFFTSRGLYYGFPSIDGAGVKVGRHSGGTPVNPNDNLTAFGTEVEDEKDLSLFFQEFIPGIKKLKHGAACLYTMTPDDKFIIDTHPNYSNVVIGAGFSGHGFKFSSAVGQALSEYIVSGTYDIDLSAFSINRFK